MEKNQNYLKLEQRYGKSELDVITKFGKNYFNGIQGWQFSKEKLEQANKNGQLLTMDLDFPGNRCKLNCVYCFAKSGENSGTYYRPDKGDKPLTLDEIRSNINKAKQMDNIPLYLKDRNSNNKDIKKNLEELQKRELIIYD